MAGSAATPEQSAALESSRTITTSTAFSRIGCSETADEVVASGCQQVLGEPNGGNRDSGALPLCFKPEFAIGWNPQKATRAEWLVFWQKALLTWAPSLTEASCYIPMAEKPAEFNVRMNLNQSDLDTLKKKADHLGVALPMGASKQQIVNKVLKAEVMSTNEACKSSVRLGSSDASKS